jgi:hypothetical protein
MESHVASIRKQEGFRRRRKCDAEKIVRTKFKKELLAGQEEGEDLSLLEFKAIQYKPRGNAVANDEQLARIAHPGKNLWT